MDTLAGVGQAASCPSSTQRLVEIYKLGQARYLRLLLSTPDLRASDRSTRTVAALAKLDRDRVATHAKTAAELEGERRALEARRAELAALRAVRGESTGRRRSAPPRPRPTSSATSTAGAT